MLSPRWRKVFRDLWGNKTRTVLIVLAIAVGVFAFGSVFITQDVLISDMNAQYRAINPSTITLYLRSSDDSLVHWALRHDDVTAAQMKSVYLVKLLEGDNTYNLYLNVFPDYENMTLDRITLENGSWPLEREKIVFERASLPLTGADIGGQVLVEMPHGGKRELTVTGTTHDLNTFPASMFPELNGYIDLRTLAWLGLPAEYTRIDLVTREGIDSVTELEVIADGLMNELQRTGVDVNSFSIREPGEHWAREVTESFSLILGFIGIFSLVLSGFLVVNTISALLAEQRRQIGMLKAIGGTGKQIIGIYLVLVAFYGALALFVAVPVGMGLAYVFTMAVVQFLNINLINFHLPVSVLILQCIAALLIPLIASAIPILGGVRITVREAVSNYGMGVKESHRLVDRLLMRLRGLSRPLLLSMRNTFRRKWRLLMTLGTLTLAGTLFITVVNVRSSLMTELDGIIERVFNYEVVLALDDSYQSQGVVRRVEDVTGVAKAEGRTTIRVERIKPDGTKGASFPVVGLPTETDFMQPVLLAGRWLEESDRNAVVLTSSLMEDMNKVSVGDKLVVEYDDREYEWDVVGTVVMAWDRVAYANFDYISRIRGEAGMATTVQVSTEPKDAQSQLDMARILEQRLKGAGIEVVYSMTKDVIVAANASQFDFLIAFLMAMAAMTALIGGLGLAGMMSLNVMERTREIGVMRSIGASNGMIGRIVVTEGLFIGIISWILALPLSIPMSLVFNSMLGGMMIDQPLVFVFAPFGIVAWLVIVICVSIIASLLPAYRAVKMSIWETLAYE